MNAHPYAEIFPLLDDDGLAELAEDIRAHGQREPITLYGGRVLDGRNRWRACELIGVEPVTREFVGDDEAALALVVSLNTVRRHLTAGQKAIAAARVLSIYEEQAKERQRRAGENTQAAARGELSANLREAEKGKAAEKAAADFGTSPRNVQHAKALLETAEIAGAL